MAPRAKNTGGIIANAVALAATVLAFPFLLLPTLKLGIVGLLVGGPIALILYVVAFLVINVGPVVGLVVSGTGRARALPWVTAALSLASLLAMVAGVQVARAHIDLDHDGRSRGPAPPSCTAKGGDGAAVGRACNENAGEPPGGDCPNDYWCMVEVQGRPDTTCRLQCRHDCECPSRMRCKFEKCTR